jgi:endonuclease/exonuclease/phosphatase family metal-dependent hydrolase
MSQTIKIVSFNLRSQYTGDGINAFIHRAGMIYDKIKKEAPDIVAFQEVIEPHYDVLPKLMPDYTFLGQFRNADYTGEGVFTAIRTADWMPIFYDVFWISPTPHLPASRFEDQSHCPRICVVTGLRHKTSGKLIRVCNIHLDHIGETSRVKGIRCVLGKIAEYERELPMPTVLLGDFNAEPGSETIRATEQSITPLLYDLTGHIPMTFHGYNYGNEPTCKIDYIYVTKTLKEAAGAVTVWDDEHCGIYLSDHYPVCVEFEVEKI